MTAKQQGESLTQIKTPHAAFIVWNYRERLMTFLTGGDQDASSVSAEEVNAVDSRIISTLSLISIKTSKSKGSPVGNFTVTLAPTRNWVAELTPGSWCAILMSQDKIKEEDFKTANQNSLKMFGKITSVRVFTEMDQSTGARRTQYVVQGEDWGHAFLNKVYIDPAAVRNEDITPAGVTRLVLDEIAKSGTVYGKKDSEQEKGLPGTSQLCKAILSVWGKQLDDGGDNSLVTPVQLVASNTYTLPEPVAGFLNKSLNASDRATVSKIIDKDRQFGVLQSNGTYKDIKESISMLAPTTFTGVRSTWDLLGSYCNPWLNELFCDLDFDSNGEPALRLWKRLKPFTIDASEIEDEAATPQVLDLVSLFTYVPKTEIRRDNVVRFDAGTNWRDKVNFVEVRLADAAGENSIELLSKLDGQAKDTAAYQREGFRPMVCRITNLFAPTDQGGQNLPATTEWKYLIKSWYFDTHRMLNGTMTLIGQNKHIAVGSNILVHASVAGHTPNFNWVQVNGLSEYLLLHVESVEHSFTVTPEGGRQFITNINFTRGILTDGDGQLSTSTLDTTSSAIGPTAGRLDEASDKTTPFEKRNRYNVHAEQSRTNDGKTNDPD